MKPGASAAQPEGQGKEIRVNLTLPVTRIGLGLLSFDPVEQLVGAPLSEILESLMTGPMFRRASESGAAVEVYPLALPDGEGATIPLGQFGELGFTADSGLLVLTVPWAVGKWLLPKLGDSVVRGPEEDTSLDGSARVARVWVQLRVGMKAVLMLGTLGEVCIEEG